MSILFILDKKTGHMGLSLTKCTQEVNGKFLQISKLLSARLTQGLPDAERSCSKLRKLRNVLPPPIPVNTSWKKIQQRKEVSKTILYCASSPWTRVWKISTSEVSSASQTQPTPYPRVLRLVWSSEPSGEQPNCTNLLQFQRWKAELWVCVWENLSL